MTKTYIWERTFWRNAMERQSSAVFDAILVWCWVQNGFQTSMSKWVWTNQNDQNVLWGWQKKPYLVDLFDSLEIDNKGLISLQLPRRERPLLAGKGSRKWRMWIGGLRCHFVPVRNFKKKPILEGHTGAVFKTPNVRDLIQTFILLVF